VVSGKQGIGIRGWGELIADLRLQKGKEASGDRHKRVRSEK